MEITQEMFWISSAFFFIVGVIAGVVISDLVSRATWNAEMDGLVKKNDPRGRNK